MNELDIRNIHFADFAYVFNKARQSASDVILQFGRRRRLEVSATSCTVLGRARFILTKLTSEHKAIRIIYIIKLFKFLVNKALDTAESG